MVSFRSLRIFVLLILLVIFKSECGVLTNSKQNGKFKLSIIHFNDFHARFEPTDTSGGPCKNETSCIGGYSRLYSQIKKMKKSNPDSLVLNAGDVAYGTLWYTIGKWNVSQAFMNKLQIDAEVFGNHEFDNNIKELVSYIKALNYPVVASNIDNSLEPTMQGIYTKSHVLVRGGKKIGIIGLVASTFNKLSNTGKLKFLPESISVNEEAERLVKEEGVFTNIILSHCGYDVDQKVAANASEKISVIIGGHSHTLLLSEGILPIPEEVKGPYPTLIKSQSGQNVAIVQAAAYCRILGNITIYLNENGELDSFSGKPILLDQNIQQDKDINEELLNWKKTMDAIGNTIIGFTDIDLENTECTYKECALGDLITDAMLNYYSRKLKQEKTPAYDIVALAHNGGIRSSFKKGNITSNDVSTVIPFKGTIDIGEVQGKHLNEIFESTISPPTAYEYRLLQVSGAKVVFNTSHPVGHRVMSLKVLSQNSLEEKYEDLVLNRTYYLVVPSFLARGGDHFEIVSNNLKNIKNGPVDEDLIANYLKNNSPIKEKIEERLIFNK